MTTAEKGPIETATEFAQELQQALPHRAELIVQIMQANALMSIAQHLGAVRETMDFLRQKATEDERPAP